MSDFLQLEEQRFRDWLNKEQSNKNLPQQHVNTWLEKQLAYQRSQARRLRKFEDG